jgi:hypothetical protein
MRVAMCGVAMLLSLLVLLSGCNKPQPQDGGTPADNGSAAAPADDGQQPAQTADSTAPAAKPEQPKRTPPDPIVGGTWFALFGRHETGVTESAWENGHRVRFVANGLALWVRVENGWEIAAMDCKYKVSGNTIQINFSAKRAVELGVAGIAPLGIGRDEEIGLLGKTPGRDEEIGLEDSGQGKKVADAERVENLSYIVDGNYLILTDSRKNLMVYAKVRDDAPDTAPVIGANWLGDIAEQSAVPALASQQADTLTLSVDAGKGNFSGKYVKGYFTGKFTNNSRQSLAVLEPLADGGLHGLTVADPYNVADLVFDFKPAAAPTS